MPLYPDIQKLSGFRRTDWRWDRARRLVAEGRYISQRRDDADTALATRYLRIWNRCRPEKRSTVLPRLFPHLYRAHGLHEQGGPRRVELQARLLAQQPILAVALSVGLTSEIVEVYESVFFNILDRLEARDWITQFAIGWWDFDPANGRNAETVLRAYAYWGGVHVLNATLPYLLGGRMQEPPASDPTTPEGRRDRSIRLAIWSDMLPWDHKTDRLLLKLGLLLHEQHRMATLTSQIGAPMAPTVAETLAACAAGTFRGAVPTAPQAPGEPATPASRQCA